MSNLGPLCYACARYRGIKPDVGFTCEAYDSIPVEIMASLWDHREPQEGDGGLRFKHRGARDEFKESDHPRGQPGNSGQFSKYSGKFSKGSGHVATHYTSQERAKKLINKIAEPPSSGVRTWQGSALYMFPGNQENNNFGETKLHVYPEFEHPFVGTTNQIEKKVDELKKTISPPIIYNSKGDPIIINGEPFRMWESDNDKNDALREAWMNDGYDGIIETDSFGTPITLAAFDPNTTLKTVKEVKSASDMEFESTPGGIRPKIHLGPLLKRESHLANVTRSELRGQHQPVANVVKDKMTPIATDPPVSEAQRRAMFAAAAGHSNLGIPKKVGEEFSSADPGGKLPSKAKDMETSDWRGLIRGLLKFFQEEAQEPEHARDATLPMYRGYDNVPAVSTAPNSSGVPMAAGVACTTKDGKVLLLKRSHKASDHANEWCLPGGWVERGEDAIGAARRELSEECGLDFLDCEGMDLRPIHRHVHDGVDYIMFATPVGPEVRATTPGQLDHESSGYQWADVTGLPKDIHPGLRKAVDESFQRLEHSLAHRKGVHDPNALAAAIGRAHGKIKDSRILPGPRRAADSRIAMDWSGRVELERNSGSNPPVFAFDKDSVRQFDDDGRLHVSDANICKAQVDEYLGSEIPDAQTLGLDPQKKYRLYRDPVELKKAYKTFSGVPILSKHVPVDAVDSHPELVVGAVGNTDWEDPCIKAPLVFWPKKAIDEIESSKKKALSPGYKYTADMTPGRTPDGESYDGRMTNIVGNHLAQVVEGRQGPDVVVGDSALKNLHYGWRSPSWAR